ncbi:hypothetical protein [Flavobacterium sp. N1736]|uniref:hypothetical protein n=1 Tax=Flavobacterium sp. N1736 TaxID=2986823 RepID=UPI002224E035|nr:hypothetical protein [Flavobacterium sp. N1736]
MKKLLCLLSAVLVTFTSCSKDDNNDPPVSVSPILLKNTTFIESDGTSSLEENVYNGNKIVSMTGEDYVIKYTYLGDQITKEEEFDKNGKLEYITEYAYTSGKLTSLIEKNNESVDYYKTQYTHGTDGIVSYDRLKGNSSTGIEEKNGASGKLTFKDGNLIKREISEPGSERLEIYEYDNKNHPFKNILGFNLLLNVASVNNLIKETTTSGSGDNIHTSITTYTYKYDVNNYPTEEVATFPKGNSVSTETTQFVY